MASFTRRAAWPLNSIQIWGTQGSATGIGTVSMTPSGLLRRSIGSNFEEIELPPGNLYQEQFESFSRAVLKGIDPIATGQDGLRSTALVNRILIEGRKC